VLPLASIIDGEVRLDDFFLEVRRWEEDLSKLWRRVGGRLSGTQSVNRAPLVTHEYVCLATRCHVTRLDSESIVFLCSALEVAVRSRFDAEGEAPPTTMKQRLECARTREWITDDAFRQAWKVWARGNHVVHNAPNAKVDPVETMQLLASVLRQLHAPEDTQILDGPL
jgi:hypothetical protein